jgi:glycosyltransferase involved in cell wall biosynthesis
MEGFRDLGWEVKPFILGDKLPAWLSSAGSEQLTFGGGWRTLAADAARLALRPMVPGLARFELGADVDWAYERFAVMQQLGAAFQRRGVPWILETNSPASREAFRERKSIRLLARALELERKAYLECDVLVCVSERLKLLLVRDMQVPERKIVVAPIGVDPRIYDPALTRPAHADGQFTIGFVGRLYPWQALDTLFHGARVARDRGAPYLNIVIVGSGIAEREFRLAAESAGPGVKVEFVGQIPMHAVPSYISSFDLTFVGPKAMDRQGMYFSPVKLLEYMAMAKPVLCAHYEALAELVQEGVTGFLFEPGDPGSLAEAILRGIRARGRLAEMGQRARQVILRGHTWRGRVADVVAQVEEILVQSGRVGAPVNRTT